MRSNDFLNRLAATALLGTVAAVSHAMVVLEFREVVPEGIVAPLVPEPNPIARLTIQNAGPDVVDFAFEHFAYAPEPDRKIGVLGLNVDPYKPVSLVGTPSSQVDSLVSSGENTYGLPGNQYRFDIGVEFEKAGCCALKGGQVATWSLTGVGLDENDFLGQVFNNGGGDPNVVALIHLQGVGNDGELSTWVKAVPEPGTTAALVAGIGWLATRRRSKRS